MPEDELGPGRLRGQPVRAVGVLGHQSPAVEAAGRDDRVREQRRGAQREPRAHAVAGDPDPVATGVGQQRLDPDPGVRVRQVRGQRADPGHRALEERLPVAGLAEVVRRCEVGDAAVAVEDVRCQHDVPPGRDAVGHLLGARPQADRVDVEQHAGAAVLAGEPGFGGSVGGADLDEGAHGREASPRPEPRVVTRPHGYDLRLPLRSPCEKSPCARARHRCHRLRRLPAHPRAARARPRGVRRGPQRGRGRRLRLGGRRHPAPLRHRGGGAGPHRRRGRGRGVLPGPLDGVRRVHGQGPQGGRAGRRGVRGGRGGAPGLPLRARSPTATCPTTCAPASRSRRCSSTRPCRPPCCARRW